MGLIVLRTVILDMVFLERGSYRYMLVACIEVN